VVSLLLDVARLWKTNYFRTFRSPNFAEHFRFLSVASLVAPSPFKAPEVAQRIHPSLSFFVCGEHLELDLSFAYSRADPVAPEFPANAEERCGILFAHSVVNKRESSVPVFLSVDYFLAACAEDSATGFELSHRFCRLMLFEVLSVSPRIDLSKSLQLPERSVDGVKSS